MLKPTEEIKERIDIVDFIKEYLELRPAGKNYKAVCPFHFEKTPSLIVSPERQIWHCFGCSSGGDIFKFLMLYENIDFAEALKTLADRAGIELKRLSPADEKQFGVLYRANEAAADFFKDQLRASARARDYLKSRKLNEETIGEFEVGFAPQNFEALTLYLLNQGFDLSDILRSGLVLKTDKGKNIDRFRGRIMFPIHNHFGKIAGFSGRLLPELETEGVGKYINSPETPIFNKSRLLYGFFKSKTFIRESKSVLLLEGQMDFLSVWQTGVNWAVATSGTALTPDHLKVLRRLADRVAIGFDSDPAGVLAAERAIDLLNEADFSVSVVDWGKDKDAAEAAVKGRLGEGLKSAKPAVEYLIDRRLSPDLNRLEIKANLRFLLQKIQNIWSPIERAYWLKTLAERSGFKESDLTEEMIKTGAGTIISSPKEKSGEEETGHSSRRELIAFHLLSLIEADRNLSERLESCEKYFPARYELAARVLLGRDKTEDQAVNSLVNLISLRSGLYADYGEEKKKEEFSSLTKELKIAFLMEEKEKVGREIRFLEKENDPLKMSPKLKAFDEISKRIQDIKNENQT